MRCIFCKSDSSRSRSVEHIIPESLGNTEHVLPRGAVCDTCNNYFARKVEGPLLETMWLKHARSRQGIESKRGLVPPMTGLLSGELIAVNFWPHDQSLAAIYEKDETKFLATLTSRANGKMYLPIYDQVDEILMSRFLAKVAIEILAARLMDGNDWEIDVIGNTQLDPIRRFARVGDVPKSWPYTRRRIYGEDYVQIENEKTYQILHEYTLLYTSNSELYAIVCLFGEEFAINYGGPDIEGYSQWLKDNASRSPLYMTDNLPLPIS